jgi:ATP-dependent helicase Lhr and Lhr-like helicase
MNYPMIIAAIRRRLKHSWLPFFSKFGKLNSVQIECIPRILDGKNVVVASPTASGKTEAVVAPVAERFISEEWESLAILYVVPTRALANDTLARIKDSLADMGIIAVLKHGDKPYLSRDNLPNCIITTPESLDSLICRRPKLFYTLRAIILDEIHLLDNTYRGDQLRLLLWRLKKLSNYKLSFYLLSATLSDPNEIAERYVSDFEVVLSEGQREIQYSIVTSIDEIYILARKNNWKKLLCFCNYRETVEDTALALGNLWVPYPVLAHHGKLSRHEREEAENLMRESDVAVCVATSTLEIGIDIGDIDLIILAEIPWSISSLIQRIGRGNRRKNIINVAVLIKSEEEKKIIEAMMKAAISGILPLENYKPDVSVAIQQIFSYLYQHPEGVPEIEILELLSLLCSKDNSKHILENLRNLGWIKFRAQYLSASTELMDLGEKGKIHSNIPESVSYKVIDVDANREVGTIQGVSDEVFVLAKKAWRVVAIHGDVIQVRHFKGKASAPLFKTQRCASAFNNLMPKE